MILDGMREEDVGKTLHTISTSWLLTKPFPVIVRPAPVFSRKF